MLTGVVLHPKAQDLPQYFSVRQAQPEDYERSCSQPQVLLLHFHIHVLPLPQDVWHPIPADGDFLHPDVVLPGQD
ncbi:hypothetical protein NGUA04_00019 [Salmonella enterica]|nr:hypothetical protein NGUA04_00019 [Salmonella enterica]GAR20292.1 hypothetical protein NGUA06_02010 [Salmonella enterica]GAR34853.1 hypothetical protein NGUA09_03410 [Salmonella enterica]GAR70536.1 hypothetical protein NGUA17_02738 [Salmonella enterica]GAR81185.1 hypothetical protein NGUA19_04237 [Salmonella enterica]